MRKLTNEEFINKCNIIHNGVYDYSLCNYDSANKKVKITCKKHGTFLQTPRSHISGSGCPECYNENRSKKQSFDFQYFLNMSKNKHGDKFDYTKSIYVNSKTKIEIICRKHGSFMQIPLNHFKISEPCPSCRKLSKDKILDKFNKKHGYKYDYSLFKYGELTTTKSYIDILCPKHGKFTQRINHHARGTGCPVCKESIGEKLISEILFEMGLILNIDFYRQKKFEGLIGQNPLLFDFYLPKYRLCIEFDGEQHIRPIKIFGGEDTFYKIKNRDKIKNEYCLNNNIRLIRFNKNNKKEIKNTLNRILYTIN